jgi:4-hydroxy-tetrahydrodipicolinate reductase
MGIVGGEPRLVVEHVTRMHDDLAPDWPHSEGGYHVIIEGVPRIVCKLDMEDEHGDHAVGGVILTATRLVNAIPAVVAAEPRPLTALDLPLVTGAGRLAP